MVRNRRLIAEVFEDLATEVTLEAEVTPVFLELNPDIRNFPNISPNEIEQNIVGDTEITEETNITE